MTSLQQLTSRLASLHPPSKTILKPANYIRYFDRGLAHRRRPSNLASANQSSFICQGRNISQTSVPGSLALVRSRSRWLTSRCVTCSLTSSFHTSSRRNVDMALIPSDFRLFLTEMIRKYEGENNCTNEHDLEQRGKELISDVIRPNYVSIVEHNLMAKRNQLPWFRDESLLWAEENVREMEDRWKDLIAPEGGRLTNHQKKVIKVMEGLTEAEQNLGAGDCRHDYRVRIIDFSRAPPMQDPFYTTSYPNGVIYIAQEFVKSLSENKLAYVLGRQMSHVFQHHIAERWAVNVFCSLVGHHGSEVIRRSTGQAWQGEGDPQLAVREVRQEFLQQMQTEFCPKTFQLSLEADKLGLQLSHEAGYDVSSARQVLADVGMSEREEFDHAGYFWRMAMWEHVYQNIHDLYRREPTRQMPPEDQPDAIEEAATWIPMMPGRVHRQEEMDWLIDDMSKSGPSQRVAGWGKSLENLLEDPIGVRLFETHCVHGDVFTGVDDWPFMQACVDYRRLQDLEKRKIKADEVYNKYLSKKSALDFWSLEDATIAKIKKEKVHGKRDLFLEAESEILGKIEREHYEGFRSSVLYLTMRAEEKEGKSLRVGKAPGNKAPWRRTSCTLL